MHTKCHVYNLKQQEQQKENFFDISSSFLRGKGERMCRPLSLEIKIVDKFQFLIRLIVKIPSAFLSTVSQSINYCEANETSASLCKAF